MANGDPVILGQENDASSPTTIRQAVTIGGVDSGGNLAGSLRLRGSLQVTQAGFAEIAPHEYSVRIPFTGSGLVLATPQQEFDGTVSARVAGTEIVIELSKQAPGSGLSVGWFVVGVTT